MLKIGNFSPYGVEEADQVDHVAVERPGRAEEPVGEVAQRPAEHQAERDRPRQRAQPAAPSRRSSRSPPSVMIGKTQV